MTSELLGRLQNVGVARISRSGDLVASNATFQRLLGAPHAPLAAALTQPRLRDLLAKPGPILYEGPLSVMGENGVGRTLRALVLAEADDIVLLLEESLEDEARASRLLRETNEELASLQREQVRTIQQLRRTEAELREALATVRTLRGLLPMCSRCKRIRDTDGHWEHLESYLEGRSEAQVTHDLCPSCSTRSIAELDRA